MTIDPIDLIKPLGARAKLRFALRGGQLVRRALRSLATAPSDLGSAGRATLQQVWSRRLLMHLQVELEGIGIDRLPPTPHVIVALHESLIDPLCLLSLGAGLRFVARNEAFDWPLAGPALRRMQHVAIDPENGASAYRGLLSAGAAAVRDGEHLAIFAQGTVLGVEAALRPGAFHVARKFGLGVVPIAVAGTHRVWEHPFSGRLRYGQRVRLTVLPVVSAAQVAAARDLETLRLRVSADLKSAALCAGGPPARRFDPDADGFWDGFAFEIDPQFDAVRRRVQQHRAERLAARRQDPQLRGAAASSRFAIARRPSTVIRHTAANR